MDLLRIRAEVAAAQAAFPTLELHSTTDGKPMVLALLQTSVGRVYSLSIFFPDNYPISGPTVFFRKPAIHASAPHKYGDGSMCYMLPRMWNPGRHHVTFVVGRAAKWLNKYEVWLETQRWPGAQLAH